MIMNGLMCDMAEFVRSLPTQLAIALGKLAEEKNPNWWKEILDNPDLHLAIREDYLNVYARGQSVFMIELSKEMKDGARRPIMRTHYKYLLRSRMPSGKEYVTFDGKDFLMKGEPIKPGLLIQTVYSSNETVPQLVQTAISYSNAEKSGVHVIAKENSNVIDMEIAFSKVREPEDPTTSKESDDDMRGKTKSTAPRIDLAALHEDGAGKARLVFYEAKRFNDQRLWGNKPEVLRQINKYDAVLDSKEDELKTAYKNVCEGLLKLRHKESAKRLSPLICDVALGRRELEIDKVSRLVVFGFDEDQKKNGLERLKSVLKEQGLDGHRLITKGSPKGLKLKWKRVNP
jgi:hypothetical protein